VGSRVIDSFVTLGANNKRGQSPPRAFVVRDFRLIAYRGLDFETWRSVQSI